MSQVTTRDLRAIFTDAVVLVAARTAGGSRASAFYGWLHSENTCTDREYYDRKVALILREIGRFKSDFVYWDTGVSRRACVACPLLPLQAI